jgi:hypothetical protein
MRARMPEYLENPRRVPRLAVRCRARLFLASGAIDTTTEDIGSRGCQVVVPSAPQRGDAIGLALSAPRYAMTLRVDGRIAWVSSKPPWHVGIAYAAQALPGAARWMEGLRQSVPDLFQARRAQERLAVDAMIFLGPVPAIADFRDDERVVLRTIGAGMRVADLRNTLSRTWPRMQRALFTLLAQGHIVVSRAAATHPVIWKHILGEPASAGPPLVNDGPIDGHDLPPSATGSQPGSPAASARITTKVPVAGPQRAASRRISEGIDAFETPRATPAVTAKPPPLPPAGRAQPIAPPAPSAQPPATRPHPGAPAAHPEPHPAEAQANPARGEGAHAPDFAGAGVGWRSAARARSAEAENLLKLGLAEMEAKRPHGALALLRRALSLAPGDPEIATAIGRAMKGDG